MSQFRVDGRRSKLEDDGGKWNRLLANVQFMEELFLDIASGWESIFEEDVDSLSKSHIMKLAGLSPKIERDRAVFARAMGMRPNGQERVEEMIGGVEMLSDDDSGAEDDSGRLLAKKNRKWREPMKGLETFSLPARAGFYLKWVEQGRVLLNFPLITNKRAVYSDLNCLLAHV